MDGSGFAPLMQRRLAEHLTLLPQPVLDQSNEMHLMSMLQNDIDQLDRVVTAAFQVVHDALTLVFLFFSLFTISVELTLISLTVLFGFLAFTLRDGAFTEHAADDLRTAQAVYIGRLSEQIRLAVPKKAMGFAATLNRKLRLQERNVVEKYDVMDVHMARADRQVHAFEGMLRLGIIGIGVVLMDMTVPAGQRAWYIKLFPSYCMLGGSLEAALSNASLSAAAANATAADVELEPARRLTIAALFSFVSAVSYIENLCESVVAWTRVFQVGRRYCCCCRYCHYCRYCRYASSRGAARRYSACSTIGTWTWSRGPSTRGRSSSGARHSAARVCRRSWRNSSLRRLLRHLPKRLHSSLPSCHPSTTRLEVPLPQLALHLLPLLPTTSIEVPLPLLARTPLPLLPLLPAARSTLAPRRNSAYTLDRSHHIHHIVRDMVLYARQAQRRRPPWSLPHSK